MNPYEVLGVERTAKVDEIKKAYRRAAKCTHPDSGGDRDEFEAVNRCWLVLQDSETRRRYDETGKMDSQEAVKTRYERAMDLLASGFKDLLSQIAQRPDFFQLDISEAVRLSLDSEIAKRIRSLMAAQEHIKDLEKVLVKLKHSPKEHEGKTSPNIFRNVTEQTIEEKRQAIEQLEETISVMRLARKLADDYDFEVDEQSVGSPKIPGYTGEWKPF